MQKNNYTCFVIMPFGQDGTDEQDRFNQIFTKSIQVIGDLLPGYRVIFKRADTDTNHLHIMSNVNDLMENADFCIADITGLKPNVLYEIGYARARDKEIIAITQDMPPYPVDIADLIIPRYQINGEEDYRLLAQSLANKIPVAIRVEEAKAHRLEEVYQVTCYQTRKLADLESAIKKASNNIDILQVNLEDFAQSYLDALTDALNGNPRLILRILTLDPESYYASERGRQLGIPTSQYRLELHRNIEKLQEKLWTWLVDGRFILKIYNDFPTQLTFFIDDEVYVGVVAKGTRSRGLITFRIDARSAGVERSFSSHFNAIWSTAVAHEHPRSGRLLRDQEYS